MKRLIAALTLVALGLAFGGTVRAAEKATVSVVVPLDEKPFKVGEMDLVRLTGKGIAGSKIEAKVEGPAKVTTTQSISNRKNGSPLIGNNVKEFTLKPSAKGKVTVKITVTPPQPGATPAVTEYEFEVQ